MPDISMCSGDGCSKKRTCYRYLATPSTWQCYSIFKPGKVGGCDSYWPYTAKDKKRAAVRTELARKIFHFLKENT